MDASSYGMGMRARVRAADIPAEVSQTAGTYVCNHVFYGLMHALRARRGVRAGVGVRLRVGIRARRRWAGTREPEGEAEDHQLTSASHQLPPAVAA